MQSRKEHKRQDHQKLSWSEACAEGKDQNQNQASDSFSNSKVSPPSFSFPPSFPIFPLSFLNPYSIHNYSLSFRKLLDTLVVGHSTE